MTWRPPRRAAIAGASAVGAALIVLVWLSRPGGTPGSTDADARAEPSPTAEHAPRARPALRSDGSPPSATSPARADGERSLWEGTNAPPPPPPAASDAPPRARPARAPMTEGAKARGQRAAVAALDDSIAALRARLDEIPGDDPRAPRLRVRLDRLEAVRAERQRAIDEGELYAEPDPTAPDTAGPED